MTSVNDVRQTFIDYFKKNGHEHVASSPLVPNNDPTLMFTAAGMVQFKNVFTGQEKRDYKRAVSSQKCVRAGGKHNDLENVGFTARHHTFFEMLGNFSFGDYFKAEAIEHAWNLVTKEFELPKEKLLVTVYSEDDEAFELWKKIAGFSEDRIIRISTSDNFWSMGNTGPCGPCTEIFYDHGENIFGGPPGSADEDGDRFMEIWNLVFMQYDQIEEGSRIDLPKPSIDTGMGLERMSAILQGTHDNYEIDLMRALIEASANETNTQPYGEQNTSHRVIADHLRASSFLISGGVLPSNEGRGYVLRRIMRRAMRHAHILGCKDPLMHRLVPSLVSQMGETYGELREAEALIVETLKQEEERFKKTLEKGLGLLEAETARLEDGEDLSGDVAFKLYDTYGFPLDLTEDVLRREQNRNVDVDAFDTAMEKQREVARASWKGSGDAATEKVWFEILDQCGPTEFLGYEKNSAEAQILALVSSDGEILKTAKASNDVAFMVTNQTPFYAESGGQVGDTGLLKSANGLEAKITDTQKKVGELFVHKVEGLKEDISVGDSVELKIDIQRRNAIRANHSATHILNKALKRHLGDHISQKGSLVDDQRLRFDISQPKAITNAQLEAIEDEVNRRIRGNSDVSTRILNIDDAREAGAVAMFGEKYDEEVRVLSMGGVDPDDENKAYSMELCGGTHVRRTGDIGLIKILSQSSVSSGVRRIEAVTGEGALAYLRQQGKYISDAAVTLKTTEAGLPERVETLVLERKKMEKEISELRRKVAASGGASGSTSEPDVKEFGGVKFTAKVLDKIPAKELKPMADELKIQLGSGVITLIAVNEGRASIVVAVTDDLTGKISAVDLVRIGSEKLGGKGGGGRPDMAQAGGPDATKANDAISAIETSLAS